MRSHLQQEGAFADAWVAPHEHERGWDHAPAQNPGNFFTCICVEGDLPDCRTMRPAATRAVASSVSLLASPWGLQLQYTCQGGMLLSCALRGYHMGGRLPAMLELGKAGGAIKAGLLSEHTSAQAHAGDKFANGPQQSTTGTLQLLRTHLQDLAEEAATWS